MRQASNITTSVNGFGCAGTRRAPLCWLTDVAHATGLERDAVKAQARRGVLVGLPAIVTLLVLFALPLIIVVVNSFGRRTRTGRTDLSALNFDAYRRLADPLVLEIAARSIGYALVTTVICLAIGYPFAYHLATRTARVKAVLIVLVMLPFWSNFLVRTYAWRVLLGSDGPFVALLEAFGLPDVRLLFTPVAVIIGLVYGYLPFMILPLYVAIERIDPVLIESARDLYASGLSAFRAVTWPLSRPGVIAGSILVFVPAVGAYVTPELLGGSRSTMLGTFVVRQFLSARDWPFGSALSVAILVVMLIGTRIYFRSGGRSL
jgi:spermidine/putrescine transport system permease protein